MVDSYVDEVIEKFSLFANVGNPKYTISDKAGEKFIGIHVGKINEIYSKAVDFVNSQLSAENTFKNKVILKQVQPKNWLDSNETTLLQRILAESLTIGKSQLSSDFHKKMIPFVGGEENNILRETNNVVYGRRGAGKSSLILYACIQAKNSKRPYAWISMQGYSQRKDFLVVPQVFHEIFSAIEAYGYESGKIQELKSILKNLESKGADLSFQDIKITLPYITRELLPFVNNHGTFFIFIDDLHLLKKELQPYLLSAIYSISRGNGIYLKITSIENTTRLYSQIDGEGLQAPGDAQIIRLDYNLTNPKRAYNHILSILNSYAKYVGIPSINELCGRGVLERLIWVSAGVPRDSLYIFNNSVTKALSENRSVVGLTDINMASADSLIEKDRHITEDTQGEEDLVRLILDDIKIFCIKEIKLNAFLVSIDNKNKLFNAIKIINDLRYLHVIHPGITPKEAGEKFQVLLLDYAFYTGFRKAPGIKEFSSSLELPSAKQLRKLKEYKYNNRTYSEDNSTGSMKPVTKAKPRKPKKEVPNEAGEWVTIRTKAARRVRAPTNKKKAKRSPNKR